MSSKGFIKVIIIKNKNSLVFSNLCKCKSSLDVDSRK